MLQDVPNVKSFDWTTFNAAVGIVTLVISLATAYLRMFIQNKMSEVKTDLLSTIESKFSQKEIVSMQISEHERRIARIEAKMETIKLIKDGEERSR